jgi:membrane protein DedA with SNARE-associated domain
MHQLIETGLQLTASGGVMVLVALAWATLISEDLACIGAGLLVAQDTLSFTAATAACFVGIIGGDLGLVLIGRTASARPRFQQMLRRWVSEQSLTRSERWFARRSASVILASRFMPGMRLPAYLAAGLLRAPLGPVALWMAIAGALWTPALVGGAVVFGRALQQHLETWSGGAPLLVLAGGLTWVAARFVLGLSTWRGRRLLLGRWRRLTRWEFWPMWAIYPPIILYVLWLALRHRSLTVVTAVNPGIGGGGGLVGESKSEILHGLAKARDAVARWTLVPPGPVDERVAKINSFLAREKLTLPIVLKPDVGQRGAGVVIVRDDRTLERAVHESPGPLIAQAYVPGVEFGVFYYRYPSARCGEILGITDKRLVSVIGDGERTLEELILSDERAVCMARFFLRTLAARLDEVPAMGDRITLSELGTHCRGALFLDGSSLVTESLRASVDRVSRAFDGFYFGRYDVRSPSVEAFQRGEFTVLELNGLTSETTGIYDPGHSLWFGWRSLGRQWRIAFEIATENRRLGARPLTLREVYRLLLPSSPSHENPGYRHQYRALRADPR